MGGAVGSGLFVEVGFIWGGDVGTGVFDGTLVGVYVTVGVAGSLVSVG
jgi:hypothetical protein